MSETPTATVFGAGDLQSLVSQLNVWTPQIELTLQELRGAQLVMSGQMQRLIESAEMELMKVIVSFRAELDTRAAEKAQSDELLKQDIQRLMMQVHQKFVEVDAAVATISSTQTASGQTASQPAPRVVPQFVPQTAPSATAQPGQSPWDAGTQQPRDSSQETEMSRRYSVDPKRWTDHKKLDWDVEPEGFVAWHDRALGYLAAERPDIRKLLIWAESQNPTIGEAEEKKGVASVGVHGDICHISYVMFESLKMIMSDSLLSRARTCEDGRGLELWRKLHAEWRGSARQVIAAKAREFQDLQRCQSMQQLWEALPSWEQLGSEVLMGGYVVPERVKARAPDKLVPQEQLSVIVSRPELADYNAKLLWVKAQMEHARGATQAQQVSATAAPKWDRDGDVSMGTVLHDASCRSANAQESSLLWHLQGECAKLAAGGDWDGVNVVNSAIMALARGTGEGRL